MDQQKHTTEDTLTDIFGSKEMRSPAPTEFIPKNKTAPEIAYQLVKDEFYPFKGAIKAIREAAELVGMEKLMWGSDYPRTITAITYKMSYDFVVKSPELSEAEKTLFLGGNARKFYGFAELPELPYIKNMSE